jgi:hypothetical protein
MGSFLSKNQNSSNASGMAGAPVFEYSSMISGNGNSNGESGVGGGLGKAIGSIGGLFASVWDHNSKRVSPSDSDGSRPLLVGTSDTLNNNFFNQQSNARGGLQFSNSFEVGPNSVPGVEIR